MLKKIIFTTLFIFSSQLFALSLDGVDEAADSVETATDAAADSSVTGKAKKPLLKVLRVAWKVQKKVSQVAQSLKAQKKALLMELKKV
jgi:uncharacterized protein YggU (UPF0235/DUF167 family)